MKHTDWMNEQWDFTIDGKANGKIRMVITLVLTAVFTVLTIDQLQPQPNKNVFVGFAFGIAAITLLSALIRLTVRYVFFKVYIGREGFYLKTTPFNGKYYPYSEIKGCSEEVRISRSRNAGGTHRYDFFVFTEKSGKTVSFQHEKSVCEREIKALQKRIQKRS